ncbi:MAG: hypothetical protein ACYC5Q_08760 [Thermoleophilia bacterium]
MLSATGTGTNLRTDAGRGLSPTLRGVLVWAVATPAVFVSLPRVPGLGPIEMDAFLGFALGLLPVVLLAWAVACGGIGTRAVGVLAATGIVGALALSAAGWLVAAASFKVVFAAAVGRLLGFQVGEPLWLALVAVVAVLADIWSVFAGPTRAVVEGAPGVLDYLLVHFPIVGHPGTGMGLGMSDVIFLSLFAAGSVRAGLRPRAGFAAMACSLLLTVAVALLWKPAIPALPFLSVAFLAANADLLLAAARRRREN